MYVCIMYVSIYTHTSSSLSIHSFLKTPNCNGIYSCKKTNNQIQNTSYYQKPTITEACHNKNHTTNTHEHTFSDKVKDMAHSARKLFHHHEPDHTQKPAGNCSCGLKKKEKRIVKNPEGHERHCMPKMLDRVKNLKATKNKEQKYSDSSSDNEITKNQN